MVLEKKIWSQIFQAACIYRSITFLTNAPFMVMRVHIITEMYIYFAFYKQIPCNIKINLVIDHDYFITLTQPLQDESGESYLSV